jgi:hypothetical protein
MDQEDAKQLLGLLVSPQVTYQLTGSALVQFHTLLVKLQNVANPPEPMRKATPPGPDEFLEA